jgi:hypothetical protein
MKKLLSRFLSSKQAERQISPFFDVGFHGDKYLLQVAEYLLKDADLFIETGTNVGTTLAYVARTNPHLRCISCEPDLPTFTDAVRHTNDLSNIFLFNESSHQFINSLHQRFGVLLNGRAVFWLDAHGYGFNWPLREEVAFITSRFESAYILIDDFKVPGLDVFRYDQYNGQTCSMEYIRAALAPDKEYQLYYPTYTEKTSMHHPLKGWGLIHYGQNAPFVIPLQLQGKMRAAEVD